MAFPKTAFGELALFAGAGGGLLGTHLLGWTPVCAVEIEPYRREVLLRRQRDGVFPLFPIWDDVRTFDGKQWNGIVDVVTGGFPCQPFSLASSKRLGEQDERNMWPDTIRIIGEVGPRHVFLENVPGLLAHPYFGTILGQLAEAGYDCSWGTFRAYDVGAPHIRTRLFIRGRLVERNGTGRADSSLADTNGGRRTSRQEQRRDDPPEAGNGGEAVPDASGIRRNAGRAEQSLQGPRASSTIPDADEKGERRLSIGTAQAHPSTGVPCWWSAEPGMGRVANGVANRVDRLKALGDGQVPAVVAKAWRALE